MSRDVLGGAVVALEQLDVVLLDANRLLDDALALAGDPLLEEALPLLIAELDAVQRLQLRAEVRDQVGLGLDGEVVVRLRLQDLDELGLKLGLGLVGRRAGRFWDELGDDRTLRADGDRLIARWLALAHAASSLKVSRRSR